MIEAYLNRLTRNFSEENRARFKRNFYNNLFIRGNKNKLSIKIVYACIFLVLVGSFSIKELKQSNLWWFSIPGFVLGLLIIHFIVELKWTIFQTSYMWKNEVLIPKKYNKIALVVAFILFILTIYLLIMSFQQQYPT